MHITRERPTSPYTCSGCGNPSGGTTCVTCAVIAASRGVERVVIVPNRMNLRGWHLVVVPLAALILGFLIGKVL